jgi:FG-GAP repeat/Zinc dependent phospholipase C
MPVIFDTTAPYPDYLYECGSNHDDGEFTHWSPFQAFASSYIRANYPLNATWSDAGQKLVSFMHGVVSHYIADINWHGLFPATGPNDYGFIQTLAIEDFATVGLAPVAHTMADEGAEFVAAYETDLSFLSPQQWYIPVGDLVAIYATAGRQVNASAIEECGAIFYAGTLAVKYLAALVEPLEVNKSPVLAERWLDLPLGGADDMAVWTGRMWTRLQGWIEMGPPTVFPDGGNGNAADTDNVDRKLSARGSKGHRHPTPTYALRPIYAALAPYMREDGLLTEDTDGKTGGLTIDLNKDGLRKALTKLQQEQGMSSHSMKLLEAALLPSSSDGDEEQQLELQMGVYLTGLLRKLLAMPSSTEDNGHHHSSPSSLSKHWPTDAKKGGMDRGKKLANQILRVPLARALSKKDTKALEAIKSLVMKSNVGDKSGCPVHAMLTLLDSWEHNTLAKLSLLSSPSSGVTGVSVGVATTTTAATPIAVLASSNALEYAASSLAAGDFDGDSLVDIVVGGYGYSYSQNGITPFESSAAAAAAASVGASNQPYLAQAGGFYVRYGGAKHENPATTGVIPLPNATDAVQHPATVFSRLGWSQCVTDFNLDGVDDLIVSAPSQGWPNNWAPSFDGPSGPWQASWYYLGAVHVYFGVKGQGLKISGDGLSLPDVMIVTGTNETHMGSTLRCLDVDDDGHSDVLVGSPMARLTNDTGDPYTSERGRLDVFLSSTNREAGSTMWLENDADISGIGESVGAWYGQAVDVVHGISIQSPLSELHRQFVLTDEEDEAAPSEDDEIASLDALVAGYPDCKQAVVALSSSAEAASGSLLVVGAPGTRVNASLAAVGRVYGYLLPSAQSKQFNEAFSCLAAASGAPSALSSPLFTVTGSTTLDNTSPTASATSKLGFALAVGHPLSPASQQAVLAVSMPSAELDTLTNNSSFLSASGGVLLWQLANITSSLPKGDVSISTLLNQPMPGNGQGPYSVRALLAASSVGTNGSWPSTNRDDFSESRFGYTLGFSDVNGDGYDDLVVGAPMYSHSFWMEPEPKESSTDASSSSTRVGTITLDSGRYVGAVLVYKGGPVDFPAGEINNAEAAASWRAQSRVQWGRAGYSYASVSQKAAALMGTKVAGSSPLLVAPWANATSLAVFVGAMRSAEPQGTAVEMPGAVYVYAEPPF